MASWRRTMGGKRRRCGIFAKALGDGGLDMGWGRRGIDDDDNYERG